jgi:hypothetical protein
VLVALSILSGIIDKEEIPVFGIESGEYKRT